MTRRRGRYSAEARRAQTAAARAAQRARLGEDGFRKLQRERSRRAVLKRGDAPDPTEVRPPKPGEPGHELYVAARKVLGPMSDLPDGWSIYDDSSTPAGTSAGSGSRFDRGPASERSADGHAELAASGLSRRSDGEPHARRVPPDRAGPCCGWPLPVLAGAQVPAGGVRVSAQAQDRGALGAPPAGCGSASGYRWHLRRGERPDGACLRAHREAVAAARLRAQKAGRVQ